MGADTHCQFVVMILPFFLIKKKLGFNWSGNWDFDKSKKQVVTNTTEKNT